MEKTVRFVWAIISSPVWIIKTIYGLTVGYVQIEQPNWINNLFKKKEGK